MKGGLSKQKSMKQKTNSKYYESAKKVARQNTENSQTIDNPI